MYFEVRGRDSNVLLKSYLKRQLLKSSVNNYVKIYGGSVILFIWPASAFFNICMLASVPGYK